ncbi:MAG TPA: hypothetical protein VMV05_10810 [bacterium]|nr:hypothetical protein [bacterium]
MKFQVRALFLVLFLPVPSLFYGNAPRPTPTQSPSFEVSRPPYLVRFQLIRQMEHYLQLKVSVIAGPATLGFTTGWVAPTPGEARDELARLTGIKEGYLFVPESCGGGNAWRCEVEHIYHSEGGLREVGTAIRNVNAQGPGECLKDGFFRDVFNALEITPFTAHYASPAFELYRKDDGRRLSLDLAETWKRNRWRYEDYANRLQPTADPAKKEALRSNFLGALALSGLCGKTAEWNGAIRQGRRVLGKKTAGQMEAYVRLRLKQLTVKDPPPGFTGPPPSNP